MGTEPSTDQQQLGPILRTVVTHRVESTGKAVTSSHSVKPPGYAPSVIHLPASSMHAHMSYIVHWMNTRHDQNHLVYLNGRRLPRVAISGLAVFHTARAMGARATIALPQSIGGQTAYAVA